MKESPVSDSEKCCRIPDFLLFCTGEVYHITAVISA